MTRQDVFDYVAEQYGTLPDYPWMSTPDGAVLRHIGSKKWYGLVMGVSSSSLHIDGEGKRDVLNLKCDHVMIGELIKKKGYLPAYHMNKEHWITLILDELDDPGEVFTLIDLSYSLTSSRKKASDR